MKRYFEQWIPRPWDFIRNTQPMMRQRAHISMYRKVCPVRRPKRKKWMENGAKCERGNM